MARIAAAAEAAHAGPVHLVLTARAENYLHGRPDLDDTIARLRAYGEAGADVALRAGPDADRRHPPRRRRGRAARSTCSRCPGAPPVPSWPRPASRGSRSAARFAFAAIDAVAQAARELREDGTYGFLARARAGSALARRAFG